MPTPVQSSRKTVTVVYVAHGRTFRKPMLVPGHQTLGWVVNASGVVPLHPELAALQAAGKLAFGVKGKALPAASPVEDGARVEVYAPVDEAAVKAARVRKTAD